MAENGESSCLNCAQPTTGAYCSSCGQSTQTPRRAVTAVAGEFLDAYFFTLDSKLTRTLRTLLFTPGQLTSQYLAGKRRSQLPPLRLYVVLLVFVFLSLNLVGKYDARYVDVTVSGVPIGEAKTDGRNVVRLLEFDEGSLPRALFGAKIDAQAARLQAISDPQVVLDMTVKAVATSLPNVLILSVPVTSWVLWLLYRRRKRHYFDHLIFTLHVQSSLLLWVLLGGLLWSLASFAAGEPVGDHTKLMDIFMPVFCGMLVVSMRMVYRETWVMTLLKGSVLVAYYWWGVFSFSGQVAAAIGIMHM